ncbi:acyl-CoA dehydrogenase family protein [Brevibacterium sandarakinum]|uniref:acyl-CoA dehydrogenase family protein n=1 Tax=Brevibacterium sandarakinum TaxID=629680 RepID=UPI002655ED90|nr:acyl-CoA dehydrogenase family protein [Brevibacterium sandarakinum]MDN5634839.1 acyl-CoA dehydrogenase family protein [Brevibacterium sp.]MDN5658763.1 acyl-CoA dehydrogenase family protein [Brevibacterium sandarakinum]
MDFAITPGAQALLDEAATFEERLICEAREREAAGRIGTDVTQDLGSAGLIAPELSTHLGGRGQSKVAAGLVTEAIARGDLNVAYLQVVGSLMGQVIARNASAEVAEHYCRLITSGAETVAIGLSEPGAGSDAGNPQTTATRDGDDWIINGTKSMSLAMTSTATVIFARTDPQAKRGKGISAFLVDLDAPGATRTAITDMGQSAVARGSVDFSDVRVPADHLLGAEGAAFSQVMQGFDFSRALIGLQCTGSASRAIDDAWAYVKDREAFDQPLSTFQGVSFPLAEAETKMAAARLLCLNTLWLGDEGLPHTSQAAMCKWWAPLEAYHAIHQCLLLHGQNGYMRNRDVEKRLRDVLGMQIGDGTAQIMKLVIARESAGRAYAP